jgi:polar amino acid transport system substrate-binding protein
MMKERNMRTRKAVIMILILVFAIASFAACGGSGAKATDESLKYVQDRGKLIMGLDDSFPPMGFRNEQNEIVGFDVDVAKAVAEKLGVELVLQPIDWNAKEQELATKNIDCIWNGMSVNEERKKNMTLSVAYMDNNMALVVRSGEGIDTLADMKDKKLALQAGSSAMDALNSKEEFKKSLKEVVELKDNVQALMNLETKAVDAVLMDDVVARYYIEVNEKPFVVLEETLATEEYAVGFRKGDEALKAAVEDALKELAKEGKLAEISEKWFGKDITKIK